MKFPTDAASRIRNQIIAIDTHMSAQLQEEFSVSYPPAMSDASLSQHQPNPNIDPSLQSAGLQDGSAGFPTGPYDFPPGANGMTGVADEQFQFLIPSELLEGFPWNSDFARGFGQIPI
jgi:hypothetical protein